MHRKMFGSTKARIVSIVAACATLLGLGFGAASLASASSSSGLCATNGTRVVRYFANCPAGTFPISFPAGTTVVVPPPVVTVVAPPVLAAGEAAAVLVKDSGVVLTSKTVPLAWSGATPPTGKTITGYSVQEKQANAVNWGSIVVSNKDATDYVVTGLKANTGYDFEVQAVYNDGTTGPWSNALPVTTPAV